MSTVNACLQKHLTTLFASHSKQTFVYMENENEPCVFHANLKHFRFNGLARRLTLNQRRTAIIRSKKGRSKIKLHTLTKSVNAWCGKMAI